MKSIMKGMVILSMLAILSEPVWAQAAQKTLFVTNNVSGTVSSFTVTEDGTLTLNGVYPAGTNPQDCGLTANGRHLVVVNATAQTIEEVYTFTVNPDGSLIRSEPPSHVGDGPLSLNVTANGFVIIPSATADNVTCFEIENGNTVFRSEAPAGTFPVKVVSTPNAQFVFCSGTSNPRYVRRYALSEEGILTELGDPVFYHGW